MTPATAKSSRKTKARTKKPRRDYEADLVNGLIELMEAGTNPWQRDWSSTTDSVHRNMINGHIYRGSNPALLHLQMMLRGIDCPLWVPTAAGRANGWLPVKGSKQACIIQPFFKDKELTDTDGKPVVDSNGDPEVLKGELAGFMYRGCLYNALDLRGVDVFDYDELPKGHYGPKRLISSAAENQAALEAAIASASSLDEHIKSEPQRLLGAETVLGEWEVPVNWMGSKAFYSPSTDKIQLPARKDFLTASGFYATWAHEVIHSTGHRSRLDRDLSGGYGTESYAEEELVAELGAFLLCARLNISSKPENHASYLNSWIRVLKESPKFLKTAFSKATRAANCVFPEIIDEQE